MREHVKWNKINAVVFMAALEMIPMIRDGKADVDALSSFHSDMNLHKIFRQRYNLADSREEQISLIKEWNHLMDFREAENYIPHGDSKHKLSYIDPFRL